jgi:hypothetical protein
MEPSASPIQEVIQELNGASQALGRAARALEQLDRMRRQGNGRPPTNGRHPPADRLSAKQLAAIRTACRRGDISEEKLSELIAQVSERATEIVELDRAEASALLDRLDEVTGYRR